ncbi:MAG: hypothetical protein ACI4EF_06745, partial [Coprococcus sp.]
MNANDENVDIGIKTTIDVSSVNKNASETNIMDENAIDFNTAIGMEEAYVITDIKIKKKEKGFFFSMPFNTTIVFIIMVLFYELLFHGHNFGFKNLNIVYIILFSVSLGGFISLLTNIFPAVVNKIAAVVFSVFIAILFIAQLIYHEVFNNYLSVAGTLKYGNQAADNYATVIENIKENIWLFMIMLLPVIFISFFSRKLVDFKPRKWWLNICLA